MKKLSESYEKKEYNNKLTPQPVESLGDGVYDGALYGHYFAYNGNIYYLKIGTKNMYPYKIRITIKNGEQQPFEFIDKYQHPDLKPLFKSLNESVKEPELPSIESLGDGVYEGALWGSVFAYNGKKYLCKSGLLNLFPCIVEIAIKDGKMIFPFKSVDECQRPGLKSLFE